jgi:hypothetical protein
MPGNLEDFMRLFAGGNTVDENEAAQYHDRFMSDHADDRDFDRDTYHESIAQHLGSLPDHDFQAAAQNAIAQAPPEQRQDMLSGLLSALGGGGGGGQGNMGNMAAGALGAVGGIAGLARMLGLGTTDPAQMSQNDAAKLMNYARKENPEALRQTVQDKPWFVKALGNPVVMSALAMAATQLLNRRRT